jgi:4-amino-4-deoxy-L-arabinose transferase-like glycosyltransferase
MLTTEKTLRDRFVPSHPMVFLFVVFVLVQLVIFYSEGITLGLEAEKYILEGNNLYNTGHFSSSKYIFYLPVILLVYLCRLTGLPFESIVIIQSAISFLSLVCFYRLVTYLSGKTTAFFCSLCLALFIPLQIWNLCLYTDSIFISFTIIYTYTVFRQGEKGIKGLLLILAGLMVLVFSRPHGILFIPPTIIYLVFRKQPRHSKWISVGCSVLLLGAMYIFLKAAFTGGGDMDAMKPFIEEHIICFVPLQPGGAHLDIIKTANPVKDLFYYIVHNPLHFLRLMGLKLLSFFNITRSYYSLPHNILLACVIIPVYFISIIGLFRYPRAFRNFGIFLFSLLILYPLGATFQCDDWHSRFTMVVFPYFILLAGLGIAGIRRKNQVN